MTTNPATVKQVLSYRAQALLHERVLLVCAAYASLKTHLFRQHSEDFKDAREAMKVADENLCEADVNSTRLSLDRLVEICTAYDAALDVVIETYDFRMRLQVVVSVLGILVAASSCLVQPKYGAQLACSTFLVGTFFALMAGVAAYNKYQSTFRYAYSLQAQMKRDLGLTIKVIEDDMNPHH